MDDPIVIAFISSFDKEINEMGILNESTAFNMKGSKEGFGQASL